MSLENRYRATCELPHVQLDTGQSAFDIDGAFVTGEEGVVYQLLLPHNLGDWGRAFDRNPSCAVLPQSSVGGRRLTHVRGRV